MEAEAELFRLLVENVKDYAIFVLDPEGRVQSWNHGAERMLGYREEEIIGQFSAIFFTPEDREAGFPQREMQQALAGGRGDDDRWHIRKDGSRFWAGGTMTPLWDENQNLRGFAKIMRDRTEWKQAEDERASRTKEAERQKRLYEAALSNTPDLVYVFDLNHRFAYVNEGLLAMWGRTWEEAIGKNCLELGYEPWHAAMHDREIDQVVATKQPIKGEVPFTGTYGRRIYEYIFVPVLGESGEVEAVAGTTRDVTEHRQVEERIRHSEERFRSLMEQAPFSIQIFSPDGRTIRVNRAWEELWGVRFEQIGGYNVLHDPQLEAKGILPDIQEGFAGRTAQIPAIEYNPNDTIPNITHEVDPRRWLSAIIYPIKDADGRIREVVLIHDDVTARRRAEIALQESEEKLRLMADTIPQLAWMAHPDGHIFWYNRRWHEYTGTTLPEMEGWGWQSVHDPEVLPKVLERWRASLATGDPFDMEFPLRGADGRFRHFLTRVNPLRDNEGRILYWFGTNTDITELREAREALAASEERLRLALDAGRMGVWDWNIRTNELKWSENLEPLHGLSPGSFGGTFEEFQELIHPDDRGMVNAAIRRAVEEGTGYDVEFRNIWPNGSTHWIAGKGQAFVGEDGQSERMIGVGLDVTQRKRAEQTAQFLAKASATLAVLVDFDSTLQKVASLAVPYFADWATVDLAESDNSLRRVAVAHVDPEKVELAHDVHRRFPPDPAATQGAWNILRAGQPEIVPEITDELLVQSVRDKELLGIMRELGLKSYIGVPLKVRGKILGVITFIAAESGHRYDATDLAVAQDLADRAAIAIENAQLYRELREADHRKDEFLATLAHELRNPLAPIRTGLELMKLSNDDPATREEIRGTMERQTQQLIMLVDDLLDVSRITRGKLELRRCRVKLSDVVQSAVEASKPFIGDAGHELLINSPDHPIYLDADPHRLAQVLSNLLNNAAKYTPEGGRIWLTCVPQGREIVVSVKDNGVGIPNDMLDHIFEMFAQIDRPMEKGYTGLGIGLTLVKSLVEMHGGRIEVQSAGPNQGSEFQVRLQVLGDSSTAEGNSHPVRQSDAPPSKRRVLVVDDNKAAAKMLSMVVKMLGNEVRIAGDGQEAVQMASEFLPDVVLMDLGMPRMNGYEAARYIRQQSWGQEMMLIALTGWGQAEDKQRTKEAGFDYHLVKPAEPSDLQRLLQESTP